MAVRRLKNMRWGLADGCAIGIRGYGRFLGANLHLMTWWTTPGSKSRPVVPTATQIALPWIVLAR